MNATSMVQNAIIQKMNDEKARLMQPAVAYIIILMVSGLVGNLMVCFYYGFKSRRNTTSLYIVTLAAYDLVVCSICMPTEIVDIELFYTFENNAACKILRFMNYFAALGSILTLVVIAVERYKKLCKITGKQITMAQSKWISLLVAFIALLLSWPSLLIYGSIKVNIPNDYNITLKGSDCTSTKDRSYRAYVWAFNIVHFVSFLVLAVALVTMYSIIGRTIFRHRNRMAQYSVRKNQPPVDSSSTPAATSSTQTGQRSSEPEKLEMEAMKNDTETLTVAKSDVDEKVSDAYVKGRNIDNRRTKNNAVTCDVNAHAWTEIPLGGSDTKNEKETKSEVLNVETANVAKSRRLQEPLDKESIKLTLMMFAVTLLFILSFLPYLSLTVWRVSTGKHEAEFLTDAGLVAFKICSRSFLLNSSLNPWIYGAFNSRFRNYFLRKLCCKTTDS